jgi:hypothetical protein
MFFSRRQGRPSSSIERCEMTADFVVTGFADRANEI